MKDSFKKPKPEVKWTARTPKAILAHLKPDSLQQLEKAQAEREVIARAWRDYYIGFTVTVI